MLWDITFWSSISPLSTYSGVSELKDAIVDVLGTLSEWLVVSGCVYARGIVLKNHSGFDLFSVHLFKRQVYYSNPAASNAGPVPLAFTGRDRNDLNLFAGPGDGSSV